MAVLRRHPLKQPFLAQKGRFCNTCNTETPKNAACVLQQKSLIKQQLMLFVTRVTLVTPKKTISKRECVNFEKVVGEKMNAKK